MTFFNQKNLSGYHFKLYPELEIFAKATKESKSNSFWDLVPHFKQLMKSGFITNLLKVEAQKISETFKYDAIQHDVGIDIIKVPEYTLSLSKLVGTTLLEDNRPELIGFGSDMVIYNLGPGSLEIEIYEAPLDQRPDLFERNKIPTLKRKLIQKKGDFIELKAGKEIIKIVKADQTTFQAFFISGLQQDIVWHYDEKTLAPKYSTVGNNQASRIQSAMMMLAKLNSKKSIPTLKKIIRAKEHFIRWSALKAIVALDPEVGYGLLQEAVNDPHPHVHKAVLATLENWNQLK